MTKTDYYNIWKNSYIDEIDEIGRRPCGEEIFLKKYKNEEEFFKILCPNSSDLQEILDHATTIDVFMDAKETAKFDVK